MGKIIDYLVSHPVVFSMLVIVSVMILFSFMKRIVRLVLIVVAVAVLYLAYVSWSGGDTKGVVRKAESVGREAVGKGRLLLEFFKGILNPADS